MSERRNLDRILILGELALTAVTASVAIGFMRLFTSGSFLADLLVMVVAAHGSAALMRRRGWPVWWSLPLHALVGIMVGSWLYLADTLWWGLPTAATWHEAADALSAAFEPFQKLVAPVPLTLGFELTMAIVVWVLAAFSDAAAFRGRAPFQAVVPHAGVVFATSIFARGEGSIGAAAIFAATVVFHVACQRALTASERRWVQDERERGPIWSVWIGAAVAALVGLMAMVAGPQFPGAGSSPLVDLRAIGRGPGPIEVSNPLVGVANLLGAQSNQVVFTVASPTPHYWRLTSLEEYDARDQQWKTNRSYRETDDGKVLDGIGFGGISRTDETAEFQVVDLGGVWLPSAFEPVEVESDIDVRHDADSSSLIAGGRRDLPEISYRVRANIPDIDEAQLRSGRARTAKVDSTYLQATGVATPVARLAEQIVDEAGARSMYERALALQTYFRKFTYRADVDYSDDADPTQAFLAAKEGFCQQFASTMALMARSLGIPARVAVGFTYGDLETVSADGATATTTGEAAPQEERYVVRGRNAHAWPELFIPGAGWLAFEPTPARGNPDAAQYTGVAMAQESAELQPESVTTTTLAGNSPDTTLPASDQLRTEDKAPRDAAALDQQSTSAAERVPAVLSGLLILAVVGVIARSAFVVARRRRRRGPRDTPAHRVRAAWVETCDWLEMLSMRPAASETPAEFARRAQARCHLTGLERLADLETQRIYSGMDIDPADAAVAEEVAASMRTLVADRVDRRRRVLSAIGWASRN